MSLDDRIRTIDPATHVDDSLVAGERAQLTLTRIVASDTSAGVLPVTRRRSRRRYVLAAAAAAGALVLVPIPGGSGRAYAGWVATARAATPAEQQTQGAACLAVNFDPGAGGGDRQYVVSLVEMRGDYAYTVLAGDDGFEATCLHRTTPGPLFGFGFGGPLVQDPSPRAVVTNSVREGEVQEGDTLFEVTGKVGTEVTAVTINAPGVDVHATISNGRFAAWWPGEASRSLLGLLKSVGPPDPDVTLTYRDGTTHRAPIQSYDVSPM